MGAKAGRPPKKRSIPKEDETFENLTDKKVRYEDREALYISGVKSEMKDIIKMFKMMALMEGYKNQTQFFKKLVEEYKQVNYPNIKI